MLCRKTLAYPLSILEQSSRRVTGDTTCLKIPHDTGHGAVLGHLHNRRQWHALAARLRYETRAQAVPAEVSLKPRCLGASLHDLTHRGRRECGADTVLPQPPKNRPLGNASGHQPCFQRFGETGVRVAFSALPCE